MATYSLGFKTAMIGKLLDNKSGLGLRELSEQSGVSITTLSNWSKAAKEGRIMDTPKRVKRVNNWTLKERFQAILETSKMSEEQLNAYCRQKGIFPNHITEWKENVIEVLERPSRTPVDNRVTQLEGEVKQLSKELNKKEKALAEAAAILFLKKKAQELWGDPEDEN